MANSKIILVLSTVPDQATASHIAHHLVEGKFAACVNIISQVKSFYYWQGKLEQSEELLLLIKTTAENYPILEQEIKNNHPYDTPEIVAVDISNGLDKYCQWVKDSIR